MVEHIASSSLEGHRTQALMRDDERATADPEPAKDAARVYDELNFDRAPAASAISYWRAERRSRGAVRRRRGGAGRPGLLRRVRALTGYELGLIAIGARNRGRRGRGRARAGSRIAATGFALGLATLPLPRLRALVINATHAQEGARPLLISASSSRSPCVLDAAPRRISVGGDFGYRALGRWKFSAPPSGARKAASPAP